MAWPLFLKLLGGLGTRSIARGVLARGVLAHGARGSIARASIARPGLFDGSRGSLFSGSSYYGRLSPSLGSSSRSLNHLGAARALGRSSLTCSAESIYLRLFSSLGSLSSSLRTFGKEREREREKKCVCKRARLRMTKF